MDGQSITLTASAATAVTYTVPTGYSGHLNINECFARTTTTIAADSTVPTVTFKKGTTLIGTITYTDGDAGNGTLVPTPASSYRSGVALAAGDTVVIAHTKATDSSSAAGACTVHTSISWGKG
jgi:hypothetical protein